MGSASETGSSQNYGITNLCMWQPRFEVRDFPFTWETHFEVHVYVRTQVQERRLETHVSACMWKTNFEAGVLRQSEACVSARLR